jgi:uncharacterized protein
MLTVLALAAALAAQPTAAPLDAVPQTRLDADLRCHLGAYRLSANRFVTVTGNGGEPRGLSYTLSDGRFGTLKEGAGGIHADEKVALSFASCRDGQLKFTWRNGAAQQGVRLRLIETVTSFTSDGIRLHGKLVLPQGRAVAAAVWVEGSNNNPSTDDSVWQYELARRGIATFAYDKRGTGASAGELTSDFHTRARDTAAAVREIRRLAPGIKRVGVIGGSQGGWVAPLTGTLVPLDFVIPAFAMAEGPIAQDQELVQQQVVRAGFDATAQAEARELTAITARIVRTNLGNDAADKAFAELDAFKTKHAESPWLKAIQPRSYTGLFVQFSTAQIKAIGPAAAQGLTFDYEPRPIIEAITPRQLWLLGGQDQQAPNATSQVILKDIQRRRSDLAVVVFANADHGLIERIETAEGKTATYSARLFDITADWIKGGELPGAGRFIILSPKE